MYKWTLQETDCRHHGNIHICLQACYQELVKLLPSLHAGEVGPSSVRQLWSFAVNMSEQRMQIYKGKRHSVESCASHVQAWRHVSWGNIVLGAALNHANRSEKTYLVNISLSIGCKPAEGVVLQGSIEIIVLGSTSGIKGIPNEVTDR